MSAEQLGLKGTCKHSSKMGVNMMLKNSSGDPKLCYVRIPNYCENNNVTVLNCSLIRGGEVVCRRPDSLVSRAAVRYSEGPKFESRSGFTLKKNICIYIIFFNGGASIITHGEKSF
jgi:hypothetical protein